MRCIRAVGWIIALVITLSIIGCGQKEPIVLTADSPLILEMSARDETNSERLYRIERDNTISFGGGFQARLGTTTWTGKLTSEDRQQVADAINEQGWFASKVESTGEPKNRVYQIDVRVSSDRRQFKVVGRNERVEAVEAVLERICLRRLEPEMNRLPEPGLQPR